MILVKRLLAALRPWISVPRNDAALVQAQHRGFSAQMPALYAILVTNTWLVSFTHFSSAPHFLTVIVPATMTGACVARMIIWHCRPARAHTADAINDLRRAATVAWGLSAAFGGWCLALMPYGDAYAKSHALFDMAVTVVGSIFCLSHLLPAALAVTVLVNGAVLLACSMS